MTCLEKYKLDHPNCNDEIVADLIYWDCPSEYGYPDKSDSNKCDNNCYDCWNREIPETPKEESKLIYAHTSTETVTEESTTTTANPVIKDSGDRTVFSTGSVRDMHEGKGDMASVPWEAILRLSVHYENGAKKYERWNFRKGIPVSSFIDSACRHLAKYQCGCDDEDHLAAAAFNVLGAMLMENTKPDMVDLPLRKGKNTFDYFKEK